MRLDFSSTQAIWLTCLFALPVLVTGWIKFCRDRVALSKLATSRLYLKVQDEPLGVEMAASMAFRFEVDADLIESARKRKHPFKLMRRAKVARAYARPENGAFTHFGAPPFVSLKTKGNILYWGCSTVCFVPFAIGLLGGTHLSAQWQIALLIPTVVGLATSPLWAWISFAHWEAHRLIHQLDELHPIDNKRARKRALPKAAASVKKSAQRASTKKVQRSRSNTRPRKNVKPAE